MDGPLLYPHQEEALEKLGNGKILWGDVGSGKTMVAAAYYVKVEADADVYVITTAKKRDSLDWEREFAKFAVGRHRDATAHGGILTVDSWNNIGKYRDVVGGFFIFDEQRLVGSGDWTDAFLTIAKRNRWILLSATPGDTWLDYIPVFIANGFYKNRSEFKREHVIYAPYVKFPKVDRYIGTATLARYRDQLLVPMPFQRRTTRNTHVVEVEYNKTDLDRVIKDRWNVYENRPLRDVAELFGVSRKVVNSDSSRLTVILDLLKKHSRLIVFYNFDYELEMLRSMLKNLTSSGLAELSPEENSRSNGLKTTEEVDRCISLETGGKMKKPEKFGNGAVLEGNGSGFSSLIGSSDGVFQIQVAEWNGHKHQEIPRSDRWIYLVQYVAGAEGWNCIETDAMVFFSLPYSYKVFHQAHGRNDRLNTPFEVLHYYILKSNSFIDRAIWKCLEQKRNFHETGYIRDRKGKNV